MSSHLDPPSEAGRQPPWLRLAGPAPIHRARLWGFTPVLASDVHDRKAAYVCTALGQGAAPCRAHGHLAAISPVARLGTFAACGQSQ